MTFRTTTLETLDFAVADDGTVDLPYPSSSTRANFVGANAAADGVVVINENEIFREADSQVSIAYGVSAITITNLSGIVWPAGATIRAELGINDNPVSALVGPPGGAVGEYLRKTSANDYEAEWAAFALIDVTAPPYGAVSGAGAAALLAAFQAAIDALPDEGGVILVPEGDFSNLAPANLTIPTTDVGSGRNARKMVVFVSQGATLPANMPGAVVTAGQRREYGDTLAAKALGRYGDHFLVLESEAHVATSSLTNQQDSILLVRGFVPQASGDFVDQEFALIRFDGATDATDANRSLRGVRGNLHAYGGAGKVRLARLYGTGSDQHAGVLTGVMVGLKRTGIVPGAFGGDGTETFESNQLRYGSSVDFCFIAQPSFGIRGCFYGQAFESDGNGNQPQSLLGMDPGNQVLKPTVAVLDLHNAGTGRILRGLDHATLTTVASIDKTWRAAFPAYRSCVATVAVEDDAVATIALPAGSGKVWVEFANTDNWWGEFRYRTGVSPLNIEISAGSATSFASPGTTLAGTTGVDGEMTVSVVGTNMLVENRSGSARAVLWHVIGNAA